MIAYLNVFEKVKEGSSMNLQRTLTFKRFKYSRVMHTAPLCSAYIKTKMGKVFFLRSDLSAF